MFGVNGILVDLRKVDVIKIVEIFKNVSEVRSFLGMINYVERFILNYLIIIVLLRDFIKNNVNFEWGRN